MHVLIGLNINLDQQITYIMKGDAWIGPGKTNL
jgi:hypothetical protein